MRCRIIPGSSIWSYRSFLNVRWRSLETGNRPWTGISRMYSHSFRRSLEKISAGSWWTRATVTLLRSLLMQISLPGSQKWNCLSVMENRWRKKNFRGLSRHWSAWWRNWNWRSRQWRKLKQTEWKWQIWRQPVRKARKNFLTRQQRW